MKIIVTLLTLFTLFLLNAFAKDYTQFSLPEGAKARLGKGSINEIQYSPDGTRLAVAGSIGIWLYDTAGYQEVALLEVGGRSVAFSPDGNIIATPSDNYTVQLWNTNAGKHIRTLTGHTSTVLSVAFSPDGNIIATASGNVSIAGTEIKEWERIDNTVRLWDTNTGKLVNTLTGHTDDVNSVAFSPDGDIIATSSDDDTVRLWDINGGVRILKGHTESSGRMVPSDSSVAFSPDGNTLATAADWGKTVRL